MKKILSYLAMTLFAFVLFAACNDDSQREVDEELIQEYVADNGLDAESTSSGLYYVVDAPGGEEKPDISNEVVIIYEGRLLDGTLFDSSNGDPVTFPLASLIEGWQEGIPLFGRGGRGTLIVPSHLGYGPRSPSPLIPANSVLVFDIELVDFN